MAKRESFELPDDAYPEGVIRFPSPDAHIPEFLSQEDDLLRYANGSNAADKDKLRSWGLNRILSTIDHLISELHGDNPFLRVKKWTDKAPLVIHLRNAIGCSFPELAAKTGGSMRRA